MKKFKVYDILFFILALFICYFFRFATVSGQSMENTLHDGDLVLVSKLSNEYNRDDIVVFKEDKLNSYLIKRVIGKSGDTVSFKSNKVYLNNELLEEPYIKSQDSYYTDNTVFVEDNNYFVMGDNRNNSLDSRSSSVGLVSNDIIFGKVVLNISKSLGVSSDFVKKCFVIVMLLSFVGLIVLRKSNTLNNN